MKTNAFVGKTKQPSDRELASALGSSHALWQSLIKELGLEGEWNSYSPKAGWSLKLKQKKRTILYMVPCEGSFRVAFVLGDKALAAARAGKLPKRILDMLAEAKKYPEGTAVRLEEVTLQDLNVIKTLAGIKLAN